MKKFLLPVLIVFVCSFVVSVEAAYNVEATFNLKRTKSKTSDDLKTFFKGNGTKFVKSKKLKLTGTVEDGSSVLILSEGTRG